MRGRARPAVTMLAPSIAVVALAAASPALGKSGVQLTLSRHHVRVGTSVRIVATGGSDNGGADSQVCIELRSGHHWRTMRCSRFVGNEVSSPTVRLSLRDTRPAVIRVRAQLFAANSHGRDRVAQQLTPVQTIRFTRR